MSTKKCKKKAQASRPLNHAIAKMGAIWVSQRELVFFKQKFYYWGSSVGETPNVAYFLLLTTNYCRAA
jgi:hypothetical protein